MKTEIVKDGTGYHVAVFSGKNNWNMIMTLHATRIVRDCRHADPDLDSIEFWQDEKYVGRIWTKSKGNNVIYTVAGVKQKLEEI